MKFERARWGKSMLPDRITRLLTAYVDGELTARQREVVVRLLHRSSEARELLHALQKDADDLRSLPRPTLSADFSQQVLDTLASRRVPPGRRSALSMPSYLPVGLSLASAAAVLLVIGLGSYLYLATVDRQHRGEVAVRDAQSGLEPAPQSMIAPPVTASAAPHSVQRERLGPPAAESEAKAPLPAAIPGTKDDKPVGDPREKLLASPLRQEATPLEDPDVPIARAFNLRDLQQAVGKQKLQQQLQKGVAHRIDLRCTDTLAAVQRLKKALEIPGIGCIIDQDAQALLKLGMGRNTPLALYLEEVTAQEMIAVLQQLSSADRTESREDRGAVGGANQVHPARPLRVFDMVVVDAMTREDQRRIPWELGLAPAQLDAPMPKEQVRAAARNLLPTITAKNAAQLQEGQGTPQVDSAKPVVESLDRQALVVAYTPGRPRPTSVELKRFLDSRKEPRAGTVQILLVLTPTK